MGGGQIFLEFSPFTEKKKRKHSIRKDWMKPLRLSSISSFFLSSFFFLARPTIFRDLFSLSCPKLLEH